MKLNIVRAIRFAALLSGAAVAQAQEALTREALSRPDPVCTMAGRAGDYGITWSGTMFLPTGPITAAAVGRVTLDDAGNVSGTQTVSKAGVIVNLKISGIYTVNPDCTGTMSVSVYDQSGALSSKVTWATMSAGDMTENYAIMTSHVAANGTNVPVVITSSSKKLFSRNWRNELPGW